MKETEEITIIRTESREKDGIDYKYALSLKENKRTDCYGIGLYSISVEMTKPDSGVTTHSEARDLFSDEQKATRFFEKIVENLATPIDLAYVVEDELRD